MEEAAEEMMAEFLKNMRQAYPDQVPIREAVPLLVVGTPVTRIVEIAEKKQAGMIIIGSHGRTGLSHLLMGSKSKPHRKNKDLFIINPPGSTSKHYLQFSKNKFSISSSVMVIFQGGVIR
jgi:hypothetical protein